MPVSVGGRRFTVPFRNAADWTVAMETASGPYDCLLYLLEWRDRDQLLDGLAFGTVDASDLHSASHRLTEECSPYRWWETYRLLMVATRPTVLGRTVVKGMDPYSLTVAQWCSGIFSLLTEHLDDSGRFKFEAQLADPPDGVDDGDDWAYQDFEQMVAQARAMPGQG
jgi:hypothetical protein